ncbi:DUF4339 domain-containing protein [Microcoleus sp. Pol7_A1]|uniref:DUF4339 domain-containing protein n=1 Tax=Microcoleus sp. Pol7_A1 TaxID=2818893 RepID=UPI002FD0EF8E
MNYSTKLSRRKLLLLLGGSLLAATTISAPSEAAKKGGRIRTPRYYPRVRNRNDDDATPSPTPSPTPPVPEPYRPTSPVVMFGVGGGVLGAFGFLGAWLVKMNQKSPSAAPSPPAQRSPVSDPIEQELNQLKADAGATRMRSVRRPTAPEVADWYVFRSGKAEGPYTALQLWEIQKITARTKVRRGEADWQRAGEVSELAKYLTKK